MRRSTGEEFVVDRNWEGEGPGDVDVPREREARRPARRRTERTPRWERVCATATCAWRARKAFWTRAQRSYGREVDIW